MDSLMKILMLCVRYPLGPGDSYMTSELADALTAAGHEVTVFVTDWEAPGGKALQVRDEAGRPKVYRIGTTAVAGLGKIVERASKWIASPLAAARTMRKTLGDERFDLVLGFTPCVTIGPQLAWLKRSYNPPSMLFIHDFFPYHHRSIGLVPSGPPFAMARRLEENLIRGFDVIGCNWPSNIDYLRSHYRLRPEQKTLWTPLWTDITPVPQEDPDEIREKWNLPLDRRIVVYGGQITEGRGIPELLAVARRAERERPDLAFLFVGSGRLTDLVTKAAGEHGNVHHIGWVERDSYLRLIRACDIGILATVEGVDSSSFPTKAIDYLRAGLPIIAAVEAESDLRSFLDEWRIGSSIAAGDTDALYAALIRQADAIATGARPQSQARKCLEEVFDVSHMVRRIESEFAASDRTA